MGQAMGLRTAVTTGTDDDIAALLTTCFGLDAATLPWFRAKATAILNEQLLTHRLRVQSCHPTPLP